MIKAQKCTLMSVKTKINSQRQRQTCKKCNVSRENSLKEGLSLFVLPSNLRSLHMIVIYRVCHHFWHLIFLHLEYQHEFVQVIVGAELVSSWLHIRKRILQLRCLCRVNHLDFLLLRLVLNFRLGVLLQLHEIRVFEFDFLVNLMVFSLIPVTSLALIPRCSPRIMTLVPGGPSAGEMPVTTGGGLIVIFIFLSVHKKLLYLVSFIEFASAAPPCSSARIQKLVPRSPPDYGT